MPLTLFRLTVAALCLGASAADSQQFPARPVRLVVAYAPGGPTDILARAVSPTLSEVLGQQILIENRPGGGGNIGAQAVAKALPDGYTLLFGEMALATNPSLYQSLPFNVSKDFTPIGMVASAPLLLVVNPSLSIRSVPELIALARDQPGKLSYGAPTGTPPHLASELFKQTHGLDILSVPYKGALPALTDVVGGTISFMFVGVSGAKPFIDSGKLRALAVTGRKRPVVLPAVPTFTEAGSPLRDMDYGSWWGMLAPAGVPRELIRKLNDSLLRTMAMPQVHERLVALNIEPTASSPEEFSIFLQAETDKWAGIIKRAGIKLE